MGVADRHTGRPREIGAGHRTGATTFDEQIALACAGLWTRHPWWSAIASVLAQVTPGVMLVLIALWGLGVLEPGAGPAVNTWTALTALAAATIARVLNEPIARYFSRPRPFEVTVLQPLVAHERGESFPSNHATGGFALAGAFLSHPGAHALLVALALLLSLSRVYTGLHYLTDVLAGAVTGTLVATGVWVTATHGFHLLI